MKLFCANYHTPSVPTSPFKIYNPNQIYNMLIIETSFSAYELEKLCDQ